MTELTYEENWSDEPGLVKQFLADNLNKGRLALILGSGISLEFGLPDGEGLISRMYKTVNEVPPVATDFTIQATLFLSKHCHGDQDTFKEVIDKCLYDRNKYSFYDLNNLSTLNGIAALVSSSVRGKSANVVTFNYDNLLELFLKFHGYVVNSKYEITDWKRKGDVNIVHPHGYISAPPGKKFISKKIVLDSASYSELAKDISNPLRIETISIMQEHFCVFIGLSGSDPNLRNLLYAAKQYNPAAIQYPYWGVSFYRKVDETDPEYKEKTGTQEAFNAVLVEMGVFPIELDEWSPDLPKYLFGICQVAAQEI